MGMHFDKDEAVQHSGRSGRTVMRHPLLSSVFYVGPGTYGGATLVVEQRISPDGQTLEPPTALRGYRCEPRPNRCGRRLQPARPSSLLLPRRRATSRPS